MSRRIRDAQGPVDHPVVTELTATNAITVPKLLTATDVGTVTTAATTVAEEHGDGLHHVTKLTMTSFSLGNTGDNASLGIGAKFYTLPAGILMIENASLSGIFDAAVSSTASTPERRSRS